MRFEAGDVAAHCRRSGGAFLAIMLLACGSDEVARGCILMSATDVVYVDVRDVQVAPGQAPIDGVQLCLDGNCLPARAVQQGVAQWGTIPFADGDFARPRPTRVEALLFAKGVRVSTATGTVTPPERDVNGGGCGPFVSQFSLAADASGIALSMASRRVPLVTHASTYPTYQPNSDSPSEVPTASEG